MVVRSHTSMLSKCLARVLQVTEWWCACPVLVGVRARCWCVCVPWAPCTLLGPVCAPDANTMETRRSHDQDAVKRFSHGSRYSARRPCPSDGLQARSLTAP
jgi:hypothetical protein